MGCVSEKPKNTGERKQDPTQPNNPPNPAAPNNPPSQHVEQGGNKDNKLSNSHFANTNSPEDYKQEAAPNGNNPAGNSRVQRNRQPDNSNIGQMLDGEPKFVGNPMESGASVGHKMSHKDNPYTVENSKNNQQNVQTSVHPPAQPSSNPNQGMKPAQSQYIKPNLEKEPNQQPYYSQIHKEPNQHPYHHQGNPVNQPQPLASTGSRIVGPSSSGVKAVQTSNVKINVSGSSHIHPSGQAEPWQSKKEDNVANILDLLKISKLEDGDVVPVEGDILVEGYLWNSGILKIASN